MPWKGKHKPPAELVVLTLVSLYKEEHYQSFLSLGLIQIEGLFYDICSIKYGEKENAGTLV